MGFDWLGMSFGVVVFTCVLCVLADGSGFGNVIVQIFSFPIFTCSKVHPDSRKFGARRFKVPLNARAFFGQSFVFAPMSSIPFRRIGRVEWKTVSSSFS